MAASFLSDDRRCSFGAGRPFVQPPDSDADMAADMENFVSLLLSFAENQRKSHQPKKKRKKREKISVRPKKTTKKKRWADAAPKNRSAPSGHRVRLAPKKGTTWGTVCKLGSKQEVAPFFAPDFPPDQQLPIGYDPVRFRPLSVRRLNTRYTQLKLGKTQ